jgi:hypothetical protein
MKRLKALFRQTEFHILLFFMCLFLFDWPLATMAGVDQLDTMFVYLFTMWAIVIFLLFLVGRSQRTSEDPEDGQVRSD